MARSSLPWPLLTTWSLILALTGLPAGSPRAANSVQDTSLTYQPRLNPERSEGLRQLPLGGALFDVLSFRARTREEKDKARAAQHQVRPEMSVSWYRPGKTVPVDIYVHKPDGHPNYMLDQVPRNQWKSGHNVFHWPIKDVLGRLPLTERELGVLVRVTPAQHTIAEAIQPAILCPAGASASRLEIRSITGYEVTIQVSSDGALTPALFARDDLVHPLFTGARRTVWQETPTTFHFDCRMGGKNRQPLKDGWYRLSFEGSTETGVRLQKYIDFYHRSTMGAPR